MISISVIIPVYNAATHLPQCVTSLLKQTFTNSEFIFINDGSTDNSQEILENFQKIDTRIILINQENKGVSVARNLGIQKAKGTYLSFVDADDTIENNFLEQLFILAQKNKVAIVTSNYSTEFQGKFIKSKAIFTTDYVFNKQEIQDKIVPFFIEQDTLNTVWNKIYAANLIKENSIIFPVGMTNGEDGLFNIAAFNKANTVLFTNYCGYNYREVQSSATRNTVSKDYFKIALEKYNFDYLTNYGIEIPTEQEAKLKATRLINQVISLTAIYFNSNKPFKVKYNYIKNMILNSQVQQCIALYWKNLYHNKSKYDQFILHCIRYKTVFLLFLANSYSTFRNK